MSPGTAMMRPTPVAVPTACRMGRPYSVSSGTVNVAPPISTGAEGLPSLRRTAWHVPQPLSLEVMQDVARTFVGEHDFAAFQARGSAVQTTVRTMWTATLDPDAALPAWCGAGTGKLLCFEVSGEGFLRHMVRAMAGTLVWAGRGRFTAAQVRQALAGAPRDAAGPTAPPHGLHLWQVHYGEMDVQ